MVSHHDVPHPVLSCEPDQLCLCHIEQTEVAMATIIQQDSKVVEVVVTQESEITSEKNSENNSANNSVTKAASGDAVTETGQPTYWVLLPLQHADGTLLPIQHTEFGFLRIQHGDCVNSVTGAKLPAVCVLLPTQHTSCALLPIQHCILFHIKQAASFLLEIQQAAAHHYGVLISEDGQCQLVQHQPQTHSPQDLVSSCIWHFLGKSQVIPDMSVPQNNQEHSCIERSRHADLDASDHHL